MLAALEAGAAFLTLIGVPHTGSGFSLLRLAMLALLITFIITSFYFALRLPHRLNQPLQPGYALVSLILALIFGTLLFLLRYLNPERFLIVYQRISPLLFFLLIISIQFSLFVLAFHYGIHFDNISSRTSIFLPILVALAFLFL